MVAEEQQLRRPRHGKRQYTQQNERENDLTVLETAAEHEGSNSTVLLSGLVCDKRA